MTLYVRGSLIEPYTGSTHEADGSDGETHE